MTTNSLPTALVAPKAPRWITTQAGLRAWDEREDWRRTAAKALSVQDRSQLLQQAEQLTSHQA